MRMAANRPVPDLMSTAALHAALDGIVEIEDLLARVHVPIHARRRAQRLEMLAAELRSVLIDLLRRDDVA